VAFCGRDARAGARVQAELAARGPTLFAPADVGCEADVRDLVALCADRLGPPGVLVNNAGRNANFDAATMTEAEWDAFFAVDLKSAWLCAKHVLPHMRAAGAGAIVNVSSIHAAVTLEGFFPYAAAKAGLAGLTRSLALDCGPHGIRVNCVCPGFVRTPMQDRELVWEAKLRGMTVEKVRDEYVSLTPLGRIEEPEDVADAVVFLCSDLARFVTGEALNVTGGVRTD
jgi:NAD(P)-dependent dehydrogenase (short-subunit alcohol dehydrogenase family)